MILLFFINCRANAQENLFENNLLDRLTGAWIMKGVVGTDSVTYEAVGSWVLNHQFFNLKMTEISNPPKYEAIIYIGFNNQKKKLIIHWLDHFGGDFSETAGYGNQLENTISLYFDYPDGMFRDFLKYDQITDQWYLLAESYNKKGEWIKFAEYVFIRKR